MINVPKGNIYLQISIFLLLYFTKLGKLFTFFVFIKLKKSDQISYKTFFFLIYFELFSKIIAYSLNLALY